MQFFSQRSDIIDPWLIKTVPEFLKHVKNRANHLQICKEIENNFYNETGSNNDIILQLSRKQLYTFWEKHIVKNQCKGKKLKQNGENK